MVGQQPVKEEPMDIDFSISPAYTQQYPNVGFGLTLISGCKNPEHPQGFDLYKRRLLRKMRKRETLAQITERIDIYDRFFQDFGYECPLPVHLKRTVHSGFPRYNLMVDTHFMAEMRAGILVAVADFERFDGALTLDVADEEEICLGIGGRPMKTKRAEIVLRDEKEIVCVLCQGPDEKTRVREDTRHVLFYSYGVPGIESQYLKEGLTVAAETIEEFGNGKIESIEIH
jgi:DNA/RNA-binding domain of Phe-tRNA-synthetase-like protein